MKKQKKINRCFEKRSIKHYLIPVILSILILGVISVFATNYINENYVTSVNGNFSEITSNNTKINESGLFYSNQKASVRTADVVVCRGTSLLDDLYKSFTCDVVCFSSDSDCNQEINLYANLKNRNVLLTCGHYPLGIDGYIYLGNNTKLSGESKSCVFLEKQSGAPDSLNADTIRNVDYISHDVEISSLTINATSDTSNVGVGMNFAGGDNIIIKDVEIFGTKGFGIFLGCQNGNIYRNNTLLNNIYIHDLRTTNDALGGGCISRGIFNNINIKLDGNLGTGTAIDITNRDRNIFSNININILNPVAGNWGFSSDFNATNEIVNNLIINGADYGLYYGGGDNNILISNFIIKNTRQPSILLNSAPDSSSNIKLHNGIIRNWTSSSETFGIKIKNVTRLELKDIDAFDILERYGFQSEGNSNNISIINSIIGNRTSEFYFIGDIPTDLYVDNHQYDDFGSLITFNCGSYNFLAGKTIHNSTTSCTCTGGSWKCWSFD